MNGFSRRLEETRRNDDPYLTNFVIVGFFAPS